MKRGIIRIVAGIVLILMQILAMIGRSSMYYYSYSYSIGFNIGFYSMGIVGIVLLIFGIAVYSEGSCSHLILHKKSKKFHTVVQYVAFSLTALLFLGYLLSFINSLPDIDFSALLMICGMLSLAIYLLFYLYKRPSCLFSASLIFISIGYLYELYSYFTYYMLVLSKMANSNLYVIFGIIPRLITSILYLIIAVRIYKEMFSVKFIKTMGLIAFALEFSNRILCNIIVFRSFYFRDWGILLSDLLPVVLLMYISIFEINTLRAPAASYGNDRT